MTSRTSSLMALIDAANAARARVDFRGTARDDACGAEAQLESLFRTSERLAVYGTLAPGRQNHHIVAPLGGEWTTGFVEGDLFIHGWGAAAGFPALRPRPGGPAVPIHVLASTALPAAWPDLDAFEGAEYRRMLIPVWSGASRAGQRVVTVANVYEASESHEG